MAEFVPGFDTAKVGIKLSQISAHVSNKRTREDIWVDLLSAHVRLFELVVRIPRLVLIAAHVSNNRTLVTFSGLHKQPRMRGYLRNRST